MSFSDIISKIGDTTISQRIVNSAFAQNNGLHLETEVELNDNQIPQANLIHTFIKNGYLDEDLDAYVTFTYPGSKSPVDFEFLHSVLQGISSPYDLKLDNPEEVIKSLHTGNMSSKEVLNYDIVECILRQGDKALIKAYFNTVRNNLIFVVKYYETNRLTQNFTDALFYKWDNCVDSIIRNLNEGSDILFELFFIAAPQTCRLKNSELSILSDKYEFICQHISKVNIEKIKHFIKEFNIRFTGLVAPTDKSNSLYEYVTSNCYFDINYDNLKLIYGKDFDKFSYTSIMNGDKQIKNYLDKHIADLINIFPESDIEESVDAIAELSHMQAICDEDYEKFLRKQTKIIQNFDHVRKEKIPLFIKSDKVMASWTNIQKFFVVEDNLDTLLPFIIKHYKELADTKVENDDNKLLQNLLMSDNNTLPIDVFKALLPCFEYYFTADEIRELEDNRLRIILEANYIQYNKASQELYASKDDKLFGDYLVHFFDNYISDDSFSIRISNKTGIQILNSHLTLEQKKTFIDNKVCLLNENGLDEYSNLICFYYSMISIDEDTNISTIVNALNMCNGKTGWKQKIELINRLNESIPYSETTEKALLDSLGGEYLNLSKYRGISHFDNNDENRNLLFYLLSKGHYISKIKEENGSLKVTFKNPPSYN